MFMFIAFKLTETVSKCGTVFYVMGVKERGVIIMP
jgi:hypothetical protein